MHIIFKTERSGQRSGGIPTVNFMCFISLVVRYRTIGEIIIFNECHTDLTSLGKGCVLCPRLNYNDKNHAIVFQGVYIIRRFIQGKYRCIGPGPKKLSLSIVPYKYPSTNHPPKIIAYYSLVRIPPHNCRI